MHVSVRLSNDPLLTHGFAPQELATLYAETAKKLLANRDVDPERLQTFGLAQQCAAASHYAAQVAPKCGLPPMYAVAGSAYWTLFEEGSPLDDGGPSRIGFEWEGPGSLDAYMARAQKRLPELHVWLVCPERRAFVDLTVRGFTVLADVHRGPGETATWANGAPPDVVAWSTDHDAPYLYDSDGNARAVYGVQPSAMLAAATALITAHTYRNPKANREKVRRAVLDTFFGPLLVQALREEREG